MVQSRVIWIALQRPAYQILLLGTSATPRSSPINPTITNKEDLQRSLSHMWQRRKHQKSIVAIGVLPLCGTHQALLPPLVILADSRADPPLSSVGDLPF